MNLRTWLNKPFPFITSFKQKLIISVCFGLFVYLFLIFFQPFGIDQITSNKSTFLLGFSLITSMILIFNFTIFPLIFNNYFKENRWKIKKEITFILYSITAIAISNYLYYSILGYNSLFRINFYLFVVMTISIGIFPVIIHVFIAELYLNNKNQRNALVLSQKLVQKDQTIIDQLNSDSEELLNIKSDLKNERFEIGPQNIYFIKSEENYCRIYYEDAKGIQKIFLRVTLKNIETQLEKHSSFMRCHRSYIVNKNLISKISGNVENPVKVTI